MKEKKQESHALKREKPSIVHYIHGENIDWKKKGKIRDGNSYVFVQPWQKEK